MAVGFGGESLVLERCGHVLSPFFFPELLSILSIPNMFRTWLDINILCYIILNFYPALLNVGIPAYLKCDYAGKFDYSLNKLSQDVLLCGGGKADFSYFFVFTQLIKLSPLDKKTLKCNMLWFLIVIIFLFLSFFLFGTIIFFRMTHTQKATLALSVWTSK